jgi:predicted AAA+ superfamily ATPase
MDQIHRVPELFPVLRGAIDRQRRRKQSTGQFFLLGSASLDLLKSHDRKLDLGRLAEYLRALSPVG